MNTLSFPTIGTPRTAKRAPIDSAALRAALGRFTTGVTVITACGPDGRTVGVTANSFNSVSMDPPLVLWSLARRSGSLPAFMAARQWAVHVLAHEQASLSTHFATPCDDKFAGIDCERAEDGTPLLSGCAARFLCRTVHQYDGGDHVILVGEVVEFERADSPTLVYHDSGYAIATRTDVQRSAVPDEGSATATSLGFLLGSAFFHMYGQLRDAGGKLGLTNVELFILLALGERGGRTRRDLVALLNYAGHPANLQAMDDLTASGHLSARECSDDADDTEFDLTESGRALVERLVMVSVRVNEEMERILGPADTVALRALLHRFVRETASVRPVEWL